MQLDHEVVRCRVGRALVVGDREADRGRSQVDHAGRIRVGAEGRTPIGPLVLGQRLTRLVGVGVGAEELDLFTTVLVEVDHQGRLDLEHGVQEAPARVRTAGAREIDLDRPECSDQLDAQHVLLVLGRLERDLDRHGLTRREVEVDRVVDGRDAAEVLGVVQGDREVLGRPLAGAVEDQGQLRDLAVSEARVRELDGLVGLEPLVDVPEVDGAEISADQGHRGDLDSGQAGFADGRDQVQVEHAAGHGRAQRHGVPGSRGAGNADEVEVVDCERALEQHVEDALADERGLEFGEVQHDVVVTVGQLEGESEGRPHAHDLIEGIVVPRQVLTGRDVGRVAGVPEVVGPVLAQRVEHVVRTDRHTQLVPGQTQGSAGQVDQGLWCAMRRLNDPRDRVPPAILGRLEGDVEAGRLAGQQHERHGLAVGHRVVVGVLAFELDVLEGDRDVLRVRQHDRLGPVALADQDLGVGEREEVRAQAGDVLVGADPVVVLDVDPVPEERSRRRVDEVRLVDQNAHALPELVLVVIEDRDQDVLDRTARADDHGAARDRVVAAGVRLAIVRERHGDVLAGHGGQFERREHHARVLEDALDMDLEADRRRSVVVHEGQGVDRGRPEQRARGRVDREHHGLVELVEGVGDRGHRGVRRKGAGRDDDRVQVEGEVDAVRGRAAHRQGRDHVRATDCGQGQADRDGAQTFAGGLARGSELDRGRRVIAVDRDHVQGGRTRLPVVRGTKLDLNGLGRLVERVVRGGQDDVRAGLPGGDDQRAGVDRVVVGLERATGEGERHADLEPRGGRQVHGQADRAPGFTGALGAGSEVDHGRIVVVDHGQQVADDRPERAVGRRGEVDLKRLVVLVEGVVDQGDGDRPAGRTGEDDQGAGFDREVVRIDRAAAYGEGHGHVEARGLGQVDGQDRGAVTLRGVAGGNLEVDRGRRVVVADRRAVHDRRSQVGPGGVAEGHDDRLVVLVELVVDQGQRQVHAGPPSRNDRRRRIEAVVVGVERGAGQDEGHRDLLAGDLRELEGDQRAAATLARRR